MKICSGFALFLLITFSCSSWAAKEENDAEFINPKLNVKELRCLVCQRTIEEIELEIANIDPSKTIDIGGYQLDPRGNKKQKSVPQAKSEVHLSEIMDTICDKLDDYVRAKYKSNNKLMLLKLMDPSGGMNRLMSEVNIVQDDDLNKSLKYYCEGVLEEWEDQIIAHFKNNSKDIDRKVCTEEAKLCEDTLPSEDDFHFADEL